MSEQTLTFWPQRRPIPPETDQWIDIGGLDYAVQIADVAPSCPQSAFSSSDPSLTPPPGEDAVFNKAAAAS
jgi:hypothetical protein